MEDLSRILHDLDQGSINVTDAKKLVLNLFSVIPPLNDSFNRSKKQNKRMRKWFEERTGLKDALLIEHMNRIDEMLNVV